MLSLPDNLGTFKYIIQSDEIAIQISVDYDMNTPIISSVYDAYLKEFFQTLIKKEKEKVVLTKV